MADKKKTAKPIEDVVLEDEETLEEEEKAPEVVAAEIAALAALDAIESERNGLDSENEDSFSSDDSLDNDSF